MLALSLVEYMVEIMVNMLNQLTYSYVQVKLTMVVNILLKYASQFRNDYEYADNFAVVLNMMLYLTMVWNRLLNLTFLVNSVLIWQ